MCCPIFIIGIATTSLMAAAYSLVTYYRLVAADRYRDEAAIAKNEQWNCQEIDYISMNERKCMNCQLGAWSKKKVRRGAISKSSFGRRKRRKVRVEGCPTETSVPGRRSRRILLKQLPDAMLATIYRSRPSSNYRVYRGITL